MSLQSINGVKIANSDGWDTYRSNNVVIQDSYIDNTDGIASLRFSIRDDD